MLISTYDDDSGSSVDDNIDEDRSVTCSLPMMIKMILLLMIIIVILVVIIIMEVTMIVVSMRLALMIKWYRWYRCHVIGVRSRTGDLWAGVAVDRAAHRLRFRGGAVDFCVVWTNPSKVEYEWSGLSIEYRCNQDIDVTKTSRNMADKNGNNNHHQEKHIWGVIFSRVPQNNQTWYV